MSASFSSLRHYGIQTGSLHDPGVFDSCDHRDDLHAVAMTRLDHLAPGLPKPTLKTGTCSSRMD